VSYLAGKSGIVIIEDGLTHFDLGIAGFLEFSFTLVCQQLYYEVNLQAAAQSLLAKHPVLGSRVNLLVDISNPNLPLPHYVT
jgi:hypothetical protein